MELVTHILVHALEDTVPLVPFLLLTYLALELLEHMAGERVNAAVRRAGAAGPVVGAVLGVVPQCGFSAMAATLYAGRVITLGTLVAVFLSTSDEMLPLLVAGGVDAGPLAGILAAKAAIALVAGVAVDGALRVLRRSPRVHAALRRGVLGPAAVAGEASLRQDVIDELAEAGEGADHIHRLCERDHCGCDDARQGSLAGDAEGRHGHGSSCDHGARDQDHTHVHAHGAGMGSPLASAVRSALAHTVQVTFFIYLVTCALVAVLEVGGEDVLAGILTANPVVAVFVAALVGLIPNCAASVVVTELYLEGVLAFGAMLAGTLVGAGAGFLVLFRTNRSVRENAVILALLYVLGVLAGVAVTAAGF